jgi:hypothetical protein
MKGPNQIDLFSRTLRNRYVENKKLRIAET